MTDTGFPSSWAETTQPLRRACYIAVGSNIDPEKNIMEALSALHLRKPLAGVSVFYRNPALDRANQPPYLNGVVRIETASPPRSIKFDILRPIEERYGRKRRDDAYAARTIDLDLVLCGGLTIHSGELDIPDLDIQTRSFISQPLVELDPNLLWPGTDEPIASMIPEKEKRSLVADWEFTQALWRRFPGAAHPDPASRVLERK